MVQPLRFKTYWRFHTETGATLELEFKQVQVQHRGWVVSESGLPFVKAAAIVEEWNCLGSKSGYQYYLHKPEL